MRKLTKKTLLHICCALSCSMALSFPVLAQPSDGPDAAAAAETSAVSEETSRSRVITAGNGETAPASADPDNTAAAVSEETGTKGTSLGMFTTTGYCNCSNCSGGHNLTYSGTVPQARHTISADINVYPIGTKLMIDDVIYTVEDMGSSVKGNWIDIYYGSHEEAVAHGMMTQEVFSVVE